MLACRRRCAVLLAPLVAWLSPLAQMRVLPGPRRSAGRDRERRRGALDPAEANCWSQARIASSMLLFAGFNPGAFRACGSAGSSGTAVRRISAAGRSRAWRGALPVRAVRGERWLELGHVPGGVAGGRFGGHRDHLAVGIRHPDGLIRGLGGGRRRKGASADSSCVQAVLSWPSSSVAAEYPPHSTLRGGPGPVDSFRGRTEAKGVPVPGPHPRFGMPTAADLCGPLGQPIMLAALAPGESNGFQRSRNDRPDPGNARDVRAAGAAGSGHPVLQASEELAHARRSPGLAEKGLGQCRAASC